MVSAGSDTCLQVKFYLDTDISVAYMSYKERHSDSVQIVNTSLKLSVREQHKSCVHLLIIEGP